MGEFNPYLVHAINTLAARIHGRSAKSGFYDPELVRPFDGMLMNVVSEVSEAQEEWRNGHDINETYWTWPEIIGSGPASYFIKVQDGVTWIRNEEYELQQGWRNPSIPEWVVLTPKLLRSMPNMIQHLKPEGIPSELADIIIRVLDICGFYDIDIAAAIADKMAYNETRSYRHGGKRS